MEFGATSSRACTLSLVMLSGDYLQRVYAFLAFLVFLGSLLVVTVANDTA